jgi:hypothetical protein
MRTSIALLALLVFSHLASAESFRASSGFSIGPDGMQVSPAAGPPLGVQYDGKGTFSTSFSLTGNRGGNRQPAAPPVVRVISPAASPPSALTDSDTFFRGVGK